jgi:MerR family transcriptional regulator, light-induced transcriptional regulator
MPTIADLPDIPKYTIKAVCSQIGLLPVTLRVWEHRYNFISPHRAENGYRLYSERDLSLLRWVKSRLDLDIPIRMIAIEIEKMKRQKSWPDLTILNLPATPKSGAIEPTYLANNLFQALVHHDETTALALLQKGHASLSLEDFLLKAITPALVEIGNAWYRGEIRIATEHFASSVIRACVMSIFQHMPTHRRAPYIVVGCAPSEQHEIASLMLAALLRNERFRVEFLGSDLPIDDLVDFVTYEKPDMVILAATTETTALEMRSFNEKLSGITPTPLFGFGGQIFNTKPGLRNKIQGTFLGETIDDSIKIVGGLIRKTPKPGR